MAATYLDAIGAAHRERAQRDERDWRTRTTAAYSGQSFLSALESPDETVAVIAEIKRRSPSKGWLAQHLDAPELARTYEGAGARAISVLTDQDHFGALATDLPDVAGAVSIPRLRKDFTVAENDVLDAVEMGSSAILLIAALLSDDELDRFFRLATSLNLDALFEVHDEAEVARVVDVGAKIIGVNQRNLHTFAVDTDHAERVVASMPANVVRVAESGLSSTSDVERAAMAGFDAVLVGESFVTNANPGEVVAAFSAVKRRARG